MKKDTELRKGENLFARFLIIMRSRPQIDKKVAIGQDEFSAVPRSLFSADGEIFLAYDKASILHALEDLPNENRINKKDKRMKFRHLSLLMREWILLMKKEAIKF